MIWGSELRHTRYILVILTVLLLQAGCSSKQSFEPVPTPLTAIDAAFKPGKDWDYRLSLHTDKAQGYSRQAVITPDKVFISDDKGVVHALDGERGRRLWQSATGLQLSSGLAYGPGKDQPVVLVGSHDGDVVAIAAADGQQQWRTRVSSDVLAPPVISDGVAIVHSIDGKLVALDVSDGQQLWSYQVQVPTLSLHGISAPLVYQERVIVGQADGRVVALSLNDGQVVWETTVAVPQGRSELERLVDVDANLAQHDGVIYAAAYQGRVVAIELRSGRLLWARDLSVYRGLVVDDNAVYVIDDADGVWALSRHNGATLWKQEALLARSLTAPVLEDDAVVIADGEGYVHWLKRQNGGFVARIRVGQKPVSVLQRGDDNALYAVAEDGRLTKLKR